MLEIVLDFDPKARKSEGLPSNSALGHIKWQSLYSKESTKKFDLTWLISKSQLKANEEGSLLYSA